MAYLVIRSGGSVEIRESRSTPRGPRSRQLARFAGALTPAVLARAAASASRPFNEEALLRRAEALGIPTPTKAPEREVRALLARLRRGDPVDPAMVGLLRRALDGLEAANIPEPLEEVAEWVGATPAERGEALRQLLDTFGRIASSRPPRRARESAFFPRFSSVKSAAAS
ncbi:MAG: hypothetical protein AB8G23_12050 [Myxococcota bacterium]